MYYIKRKTKKVKEKSPRERKPSVASLTKKLDKVFSQFIRLRDSQPFGYKAFRCISCGQVKPFDQMDCGHFISRVHMSTRFDENNCHGECKACNRFRADHMIYYQANLVRKIGQDKVDILIAKGHQSRKYSPFELEVLIKYYTERVNEMKNG